MGELKHAKKNAPDNQARSDHSSARAGVQPLLKPEEIVDLRDIRSEIENALGKKAVTGEQRALQALGRLMTSKPSAKKPVDGSLYRHPPVPEASAIGSHKPPLHLPCQAMQAAAQPSENDLVGWRNWGIIDSQTLQLGSCWLCQSNGRPSARGATRPPSIEV
jgi:hypothetical protein